MELEEAKAGFPHAEGSRDRINPLQKNPSIIRCNGSEETVAFGCDFISTAANLGAICFALANDKRFFLEEEAEMAKDFGDLMGCVVRKFRGGVRFAHYGKQ